jgi:hypothetical protein
MTVPPAPPTPPPTASTRILAILKAHAFPVALGGLALVFAIVLWFTV